MTFPSMNSGGHEIQNATDLIGKWITFICANGIVVAGVCVEGIETDHGAGPRVQYTLPGNPGQSGVSLSAMEFLYVHPVRGYDDFVSPSRVHAGQRTEIRQQVG